MFNKSARDNIVYGRADAAEEDIIAAETRWRARIYIRPREITRGAKGMMLS